MIEMIKNIVIFILVLLLIGSGYFIYIEYSKTQELLAEKKTTCDCQRCAENLELLRELQREQMFDSAREYIKKYSVEGMEVEFRVIKETDNWALLEAAPINVETDNVSVILEKVDGKWKTHTFGTILPGWEEKVPELFN